MNIRAFIQASFQAAITIPMTANAPKELHSARSRAWIQSLAAQFATYYTDDAIRIFSRYDSANRPDFGLNELLHDVLVCQVDTVPSAKHGKQLFYIQDALWQVESEFAHDSQEALRDFNKLVLGAGRSKLFIGPQGGNNQAFINTLLPAAQACSGTVYVALIPHPAEWGTGNDHIDTWIYAGKQWTVLS